MLTPWDWRQRFELLEFDVAARDAGQPEVGWEATVREAGGGTTRQVAGHVQVRWSHGRFSATEGKVYLDTPHPDVAGYVAL